MLWNIRYYLKTVGMIALIYAIIGKLINKITPLNMKEEGVQFPFYLRVPSTDVPTYEQVFIHKEYNFDLKREPKVIIDAGANIGLASIYFANKYPRAKIISIEPEKTNFDLLKKNVAPYKNVTPVQAALWHENGEINLIDSGLGNWGFTTQANTSQGIVINHNDPVAHLVKALTIDKILDEYGLEQIDILKIDIEGSEKEVFDASSKWINRVDTLIVELHEDVKPGCNRSFYNNSNGFNNEWVQGENVYLSRGGMMSA